MCRLLFYYFILFYEEIMIYIIYKQVWATGQDYGLPTQRAWVRFLVEYFRKDFLLGNAASVLGLV
jgi:hypothetical protein